MDRIILLDRAWPALRYEISQEAQGLLWKKNARTPFRSTHGVPSTLRHGRGHGKLVPKAAKGAAKGGGASLTVPVLDRAGGCAGAIPVPVTTTDFQKLDKKQHVRGSPKRPVLSGSLFEV